MMDKCTQPHKDGKHKTCDGGVIAKMQVQFGAISKPDVVCNNYTKYEVA